MKKKKGEVTIRSSAAEYLTYVASVGDQQDSIEMRYEDENIWLTQKMMATLYNVDVRTINEHIKKIYSDSELEEDSTIRNFRIVQTVDKLGVGSYAQHHFSLIINSFFIFLKKAKNPAVFQPRFSSIFASFFKFMHAKVSPAFISIRALPVYCV